MGLTVRQLGAAVGVPDQRVRKWLKDGLPGEKNERGHWQFDPESVSRWLIDQGIAKPTGPDKASEIQDESQREEYLRTRQEVAEYFGVGVRTVADWLRRPGFPGTSGDRFERNGVFPSRRIERWLSENNLGPESTRGGADDSIRELREVKIELAKIELEQKRGELIDREEVIRFIAQQHAIAKQSLSNLPSLLVGMLPDSFDDRVVDDFRQRAEGIVAKAIVAMATGFEARETDEDESEPND